MRLFKTTEIYVRKGATLLITMIIMIAMTSVVGAYPGMVQHCTKSIGAQIVDSQAIYPADAGLDLAIRYLRNTARGGSTDCSWRTADYPASPDPDATDPQQRDNVFIDPTLYDPEQNYPALYAGTSINSTDAGKLSQRICLQNSTINGLILVNNNITFNYISNSTFNDTILAGNNIEMENGVNLIVNYNEDIFSPMPLGLTFSGGEKTILPKNDRNEI